MFLIAGSGCAALVYEIVWYQLLELVVGSSGVSLGVLLGTFMGGLCLGSLLLPRLISSRWHPLRVYGVLELGIGVCGILALIGIPYAGRFYVAAAGHGLPGILLRAAVCAVCLLVPTTLMGATLPALARWVETTPRGVSWLGFFYASNTCGAVFGCLLAGFYLLRVHDMATATYFAALLNGVVALFSFKLAGRARHVVPAGSPDQAPVERAAGAWAVYVTIAISGLSALGSEVIWTRLLSLTLGATVYTFSVILAVFLIGIGIGSGLGSVWARKSPQPSLALGLCQFFLAAAIAWAAFVITRALPYWPLNASLLTSPWYIFQAHLVRCLLAALPASLLWGASFPLALAAVAKRGQDPGRLVGGVYAANTVGAILGALAFSMVLIPWIGTQDSQRVLIGLAAVSASVVLVWTAGPSRPRLRIAGAAALAASLGMVAVLSWSVARIPWEVVAYGRQSQQGREKLKLRPTGTAGILQMAEGMNASIAITEWTDGKRMFHVSGKVEASGELFDMRLQRMLAHLPALLHPAPRSVLVVGFGAGVTAGSFVPYPSVEKIVICEIEPLIPKLATQYFSRENYNVLYDKRTQVVYDDARHYILTAREKFDIITSDPIHPWVKGSATLYSKEYFEMCKQHLNPGGLFTQWVPLYETNMDTVKTELATFFEVFPNGSFWGNEVDGVGYDGVLLGQAGPATINVDQVEQRLARRDYVPVANSMSEADFDSALSLLASYAGQASDMKAWLKDAQVNRDRDLRLQYLAGMGLNFQERGTIYSEILRQRRFPENLFVASDSVTAVLRELFRGPGQEIGASTPESLRARAEQGDGISQFNLGIMYYQGQGVVQDYAEAARWYRKAAELGVTKAQFNLGVMYAQGRGVARDYAEAARWYRKAAEQGDPGAQFNLGVMYHQGQGVAQDYAEAVRWIRKAAEQGDPNAQFNLGISYGQGQGVAQDYVQAHLWLSLAVSNASETNRRVPADSRDALARKMSPSQIAEAQRLAREWKPR